MINSNYLDFLAENSLTPNGFTVLWCIYNSEEEKLEKLFSPTKLNTLKNHLRVLEFLDDDYPTDKFTKHFLEDIEEAADEIWRIWYPGVKLRVNNKQYSAKGIEYDEFVLGYAKITKKVVERHLEIKQITENYVKANPEPPMQLKKYIGTRFFDDIVDQFTDISKESDDLMKYL